MMFDGKGANRRLCRDRGPFARTPGVMIGFFVAASHGSASALRGSARRMKRDLTAVSGESKTLE